MADLFANIANVALAEIAAVTLTFRELNTGAAVFEKMAMIIHRIEYEPSAESVNLLDALDDEVTAGWTTSNSLTGLAKDKPAVIDRFSLARQDNGAPANAYIFERPWVHNFADLPNGGLIVPATSLFFAVLGVSVASPVYFRSTLYFSYKALKGEEFWELVEATRALS